MKNEGRFVHLANQCLNHWLTNPTLNSCRASIRAVMRLTSKFVGTGIVGSGIVFSAVFEKPELPCGFNAVTGALALTRKQYTLPAATEAST